MFFSSRGQPGSVSFFSLRRDFELSLDEMQLKRTVFRTLVCNLAKSQSVVSLFFC